MYLKPKEMFDKANALAIKGDKASLEEAERIAATLLQHMPNDASTLALLGKIMAIKQYYGIARHINYRAIDMLPEDERFDMNRAEYYNNTGYCCRYLNLIQEGRDCYKKALEYADGEHQDIYGNLAAMYVARDEAEEGIKYADKAIAADPNDLSPQNNKSMMLLELGRWEKGFGMYDARMVLKEERGEKMWRDYPGIPLWDGAPGKTVIIYGEQGIGDEVMFASMLKDIANDCTIVFDCHDRLYNLFKASFPELTIYGTKRQEPSQLGWLKNHKIDAKLPIGSIARFYRRKDEDFPKDPYLKPTDGAIERIGERVRALGNRPKIGFSWMGGKIDTHCFQRHIPLSMWDEIFKMDADFISLQYDKEADAVIREHNERTGLKLHHWPDIVCHEDYNETAALLANLDMVISVPQSVVHLAGGMGIPTMQLAPKHAMWQMGVYGQDMPWYGCVRTYWQREQGDWKPVLDAARHDLEQLIQYAKEAA